MSNPTRKKRNKANFDHIEALIRKGYKILKIGTQQMT